MPFPDAKYPPQHQQRMLMQWQTEASPGAWFEDHGEVYDGHNQVVCFMPTETHNGRGLYNVANARLLAAAPDMLAALQQLVPIRRDGSYACCCDDPPHSSDGSRCPYCVAAYAIRIATEGD